MEVSPAFMIRPITLIRLVSLLLLQAMLFVSSAQAGAAVLDGIVNTAFSPGEKLTYDISWSNIIEAGIAVMEVKEGRTPEGKPAYIYVSTTRSVGIVERFFPVRDTVKSIVDAAGLYSDVFSLKESHGKKKREREMVFDHDNGTVRVTVNGESKTYPARPWVQDPLSSLYYIRARDDFIVGKSLRVDVHDNDKTWAVDIQVLGKERIKTPAGEFDTVLVKTYPKYEGVFMNKGEIYIWMTDDSRRMPVLMKSTITIGSIVATLTGYEEGGAQK